MKFSIFILTLLFVPPSHAETVGLPESIRAPEGFQVILKTYAKGYQVYHCDRLEGRYQWRLKAPDAVLLDENGGKIGTHFEGPTWKHRDGSLVVGKLSAKTDAEESGAVPWLLVEVVDRKGRGVLSDVGYINRLNTHGGAVSAHGCDGNHAGAIRKVPYRANYFFFSKPVE
ncbi:MAG: DUF3455 domain-containing protein [Gammaproteobacteria bacterium]